MYQTVYNGTLIKEPYNPMVVQEMRSVLEEFKEIFENNFDTVCFSVVIEKVSFDQSALREIRMMAAHPHLSLDDLSIIHNGLESLELFISFARRYIQPFLRDLLGVSGFYAPIGKDENIRTVKAMKSMIVYTFPYNLDKLEEVYFSLKSCFVLLN